MANDEKFVLLIQSREIIYNPKLKDHHNRNVVEIMWKEVGEEMNMTVNECKQRWTNLRNSYARHLRNLSKPSGSGGDIKPKWYLADTMSFLKDHMQHRKQKGNSQPLEEQETSQPIVEGIDIPDESIETAQLPQLSIKRHSSSDSERNVRPKRQLPSQQVVGPMIEFLKSNTINAKVEEHPLVNSIKAIIPDYNSLAPKRQRTFRQKIITVMNELMDEQEIENQFPSTHSFMLPHPSSENLVSDEAIFVSNATETD